MSRFKLTRHFLRYIPSRTFSSQNTHLENVGPMASRLRSRSVVRFSGPDTVKFLQGLLTNDVQKRFGGSGEEEEKSTLVTSNLPLKVAPPMYAALLTAQGRFLYDLVLYSPPRDDEKLDRTGSGPGWGAGDVGLFADVDGSVVDELIETLKKKGAEVPEIEWCEPGETAAKEMLMGSKNGFLTKRLKNYAVDRNNPLKPKALSGLSPYLHFGQISAQRCAFEARNVRKDCPQAVDAFLEELIVRRELADNFCYYQPNYDSIMGAWEWARKSLLAHASDKRDHIYMREQLEKAQTADPVSFRL